MKQLLLQRKKYFSKKDKVVMMMIFQCISVLRFHKSQRNVSTTKWPNHDRSKEWRQMEKLKIKITRISEL